MNNDYLIKSGIKNNIDDVQHLSQLVSPTFSPKKDDSSFKIFTRGCKHFPKVISCFFRKVWYGLTHHLTWMTDEKLENKITKKVTKLDDAIDKLYLQEHKEAKDFIKISINNARKAIIRLHKVNSNPDQYVQALAKIDHIKNLWEVKEKVAVEWQNDAPLEEDQDIRRERKTKNQNNGLLSEKMLAHVLGGFMIEKTGRLEGEASVNTLRYTIDFIDHFLTQGNKFNHQIPLSNLQKLKMELEGATDVTKKIEALQDRVYNIGRAENNLMRSLASETDSEKIKQKKLKCEQQKQALVNDLLKNLKNLKTGNDILFTGGWVGVPGGPGHAMMYRFKKNEKGNIDLSIINTGSGIESHNYILQGTKKKYNPVRQFNDLEFKNGEIDDRLLTSFLEKQILPLTSEAPIMDSRDIYGVEVERLKSKETPVPLELKNAITGQRSGVCAYKSVLITSRLSLGLEDYKVFKHSLELKALNEGAAKLENGDYAGKNEHHVIHILDRASKRMMAATVKLRQSKLLTKQEAREAYNQAKSVLASVDTVKKQTNPPLTPKFVETFSPNLLGQSIHSVQSSMTRFPVNSDSFYMQYFAPEVPSSSKPQVFLDELIDCVNKFGTPISIKKHFIYNVLESIDFATHKELWREISLDPVMREKAIGALSKLTQLLTNRHGFEPALPQENAIIINLFTINALLAKEQWGMEPMLANFGPSGDQFDSLYNEWGCKDVFGPSFTHNLSSLNEFSKNKDQLFVRRSENTLIMTFKSPTKFTNISDLEFLEALLKSKPELVEKINLSTEDLRAINSNLLLGNGLKERTIRYKALKLFTPGSGSDYYDIQDNPFYAVYKSLQLLNSASTHNFKICGGDRLIIDVDTAEISLTLQPGVPPKDLQAYLAQALPKKQLDPETGMLNLELFGKENFHKVQNSILTRYGTATNTTLASDIERDLITIGSDKEVQIDHLLDLFEGNPSWVSIPVRQLYFKSRLLEDDILFTQLQAEPLLAKRFIEFLQSHFTSVVKNKQTLSIDEINAQLFLTQLIQKTIVYLRKQKELHNTEIEVGALDSFDENLKILRAERRDYLISQKEDAIMPWLKVAIDYTLLYLDPFFENEGSAKDARQILMNAAIAQRGLVALKTNPAFEQEAKNYYDPQIEFEVNNSLLSKKKSFEKLLGSGCKELCQQIMGLYDYPQIPALKWEGNFPFFSAMAKDKNLYTANVLTGSIEVYSRQYGAFDLNLAKHSLYQQLFKKEDRKLEWLPYGKSGFQTTFVGNLIKLVPGKGEYEGELQIILEHNGFSYMLQSQKFVNQLKLPLAFRSNILLWITPQASESAMLIFDRSMKEKLCEGVREGYLFQNSSKQLEFVELINHPQLARIGNFMKGKATTWSQENTIKKITYREVKDERNEPLTFSTDRTGNLCWNKDPKFIIADNQSVQELKGFKNYILLENLSSNDRIILLPRKVKNGRYTYAIIPLSENGLLAPSNCLQNLYAAATLYAEGDYESSIKYLFHAKEARTYTKEETALLNTIIFNKIGDPWAEVLKIYAATQLIDNMDLTPPSARPKEFTVKTLRKLLETIGRSYSSFVANRNVPEKYQPRQVLGIDREGRLLEKLVKAERYSNILSPELHEYRLEFTKKQYSANQKEFFSGQPISDPLVECNDPSSLSFFKILSESPQMTPEYLNRPGAQFKNNFRSYYEQACSEDSDVRKSLSDRLQFMRFDNDTDNYWYVQVLKHVLLYKENVNQNTGLKNINLPKLPSQKEIEDRLDPIKTKYEFSAEYHLRGEIIAIASEVLKKFNNFMRKLSTSIIYKKEKDVKEPYYHNYGDRPEVAKLIKYNTSKFTPAHVPDLIENGSSYTTNKVIPVSSATLYTPEQLNDLHQRMNLPKYVYKKLESLNELVSSKETSNTPQPIVKADIEISVLKSTLLDRIGSAKPETERLHEQIIRLANKMSGDPKQDLLLDLLRGSDKIEAWTLEKCLATFMHERWDLFQIQIPPLTTEEINQLHKMITEFLVASIDIQKAERAVVLLEELEKVKGAPAANEKVRSELGTLMVHSRIYDPNSNPALLLFEYASGWTISHAQTSMLKKMFEIDGEGNFQNIVLQLIMGGGKSKVISPIQAQMKADGAHLSLLVVPDSLYETNRNDTTKSSRDLFAQNGKSLEFSREDNTVGYLETLLYTLQEAITHREYVIARPKDLLCLELELWESHLRYSQLEGDKSKPLTIKDSEEWGKKAQLLIKILALLKNKGCATFDESDSIFYCKYHVNFTLGQSTPSDQDTIDLVSDVYRLLAVHPELRQTVRLHQNRQTLLTDQQLNRVKEILLNEMVSRILTKTKLPISSEAIYQYCEGKDTEINRKTYRELQKLYRTEEPKTIKAVKKLALLKMEIESLLQETLGKSVNTHYGLSKEHQEIGFAIPYAANNTPNEKSQFADACETMNKTFQTFLSEWKSPSQTKQLVEYLRGKVQSYTDRGLTTEAEELQAKFKEVTSQDLYPTKLSESEFIEAATELLDERIKQNELHPATIDMVIDYVVQIPLKQQLKIYGSQLSSSTQDLDSIVASSQGYSGTVSSKNTFPARITTFENPETDREISRALIGGRCPVLEMREEAPDMVLRNLFENRNDASSFRAFIDTGALFKGRSNNETAVKMLSYFEQHKKDVQAVLYWDDKTNIPMIIYRHQGLLIKIPLDGTSRNDVESACEKLKLTPNQLFTYYDERHIVGTDLYYDPTSKAFATHSSKTLKDKMFQGVMRMRGAVKREHRIEFVIHQEEMKKMSHTFKLDPARPLTIEDLIVHSEFVQSNQELRDNLDATQQMMLKKIKEPFRKNVLESTYEYQSQNWFEVLRPFVEQKETMDPFLKYGGILSEENVHDYLQSYMDTLLGKLQDGPAFMDKAETIQLLRGQLSKIIEQQIKKGCLPEKIFSQTSTNVEVQRQVETAKETEQNKELEKNIEQLQFSADKTPYQEKEWKTINLFNKEIAFAPSETRIPKITYLYEILKQMEFGNLIDKEIMISGNFLHTLDGTEISIFNQLQKGIVDILVIEENNDVKVMIISSKEAAFFKTMIAKQKQQKAVSEFRNLWLVNPEGKIIQQGSAPWSDLMRSPRKDKVDRLLFQTLCLSGNLRRVNHKREKLANWIGKSTPGSSEKMNRKNQLKIMLETTSARLPLESNKLSNYPELQELVG